MKNIVHCAHSASSNAVTSTTRIPLLILNGMTPQHLDQTLGVPKPDLIVLDALRRQRNVNDYEGDPIADATLHACLQAADKLLGHTQRWLQAQHPEWGLV